jgi:putative ABC transport system permease protein
MRSDVRDAFRSLVRDRGFTTVAVLLFALTGGVTTAVYAVVQSVVLQPMSFGDQKRTVVIWERDLARQTPVVEVALGEVNAWRERSSSFDALGVFSSTNSRLTIIDGDARTRASSSSVSASFFDVTGVRPGLGRTFDSSDEVGSVARVAVISDGLWTRQFASDPQVIGRTMLVQRRIEAPPQLIEIVGVMPQGFEFPRGVDVWLPAAPLLRAAARNPADPADLAWYLDHFKVFYAIGRLRHAATTVTSQRELSLIMSQAQQTSPTGRPGDAVVTAIDDYLIGPTKPVLWTMLAGAGLMVLLASSSVAGLHLFRSARQDREIAIQLALGASRDRLVRRSLIESGLLSLSGAAGAFAVAGLVTRAFVFTAPVDVPRLNAASVMAIPALVVMAMLALLTGAISGIWPAIFVGRVDAGRTLAFGIRAAMHPRERLIQRVVVGWQVTVAVVLLSGAALFTRSVHQLDRTPLGFNADGLVSIELQPAAPQIDRWDQFFDVLRARVEALPHIASAGAVALRPLSGPVGNDTIPALKGQAGLGPDAAWRNNPRANLQPVTPGYRQTLGTRLLAGRDFTPADVAASPNVVIVSASAAERYWPGRDPIGEPLVVATQRLPGSIEEPRWMTVVGVVEDVRYRGIIDPRLDVYLPAAQSTIRVAHLLVRTTSDPVAAMTDVARIARDLDPGVVVGEMSTMSDVVARETAPWRFAMRLLTLFGILASILATSGLVGLVSLVVTLRKRELGIRAALGATPRRLRAHVLIETVWTAGAAAGIGVLAALALGRLVESLLVDTPTNDAVSIAGAATLTLAAGMLGCMVPAARAAASNPADVLRD